MQFISSLLNAIFVKHPLHSMTVHFPIALSAVALLFIVLAWQRRSQVWEKFAFTNLTLAALSTPFAALAGIRDNLVRFGGSASNAGAKAVLALALLIVAALTVYWRRRENVVLWESSRKALFLLGFAISFLLAAVLGFLGGVILYGF